MKSFTLIVFALFVTQAMAQSTTTTLKKTSNEQSTLGNSSTGEISESSTMKLLREKLQVRYFAEFLGPNVVKWDENQVDVDGKGNYAKSDEPIGTFHQFSLRWKVADTTRIYVEPRFTTHFADRDELRAAGGDDSSVRMEDFRGGVMSNYWSSEDKIFSTTYRVGSRFSTSQASRESDITAQPEALHIFSWQPTAALNVSLWNQVRYYWYQAEVDNERWRLYTAPSVTYVLNDTFSVFVMYEHEQNHSAPEGKRNYFHSVNTLQDVYAGVNINVNPSLTIYPFVRMAQLKKLNDETLQVGAWIMGAIF